MLSNANFDSHAAADLYEQRLREYQLAEAVGFDGIMLNEHHTAPFCMSPRINSFASVLAALTKRVKLVLLGNPLPIVDSPVQMAEEIALADMISKGRLVSGFVRGGGGENIQANVNPIHNRSRFEEANDLIIKIWTEPGPFSWEGENYQYRVVNPWALPYQKPHPRIWIPGVVSKETVVWAAQHGYPYIGLNTNFELSARIKQIYGDAAADAGFTPGPEHFGQLLQCQVQSSEEKAERNARQFMWMAGEFTGLTHPVWGAPSGYSSRSSRKSSIEVAAGLKPNRIAPPLDQRRAEQTFLWGTPKQIIPKLKMVLERNRVGIMALWANDGRISAADSDECIRLLGEEVLPELREFPKSIDLKDPFEANSPVSLATASAGETAGRSKQPAPVTARQ